MLCGSVRKVNTSVTPICLNSGTLPACPVQQKWLSAIYCNIALLRIVIVLFWFEFDFGFRHGCDCDCDGGCDCDGC